MAGNYRPISGSLRVGDEGSGEGDGAVGCRAVKEGVGRFTGDDDLAMECLAERAVGDVKDAAGVVGESVGETIHDLNR